MRSVNPVDGEVVAEYSEHTDGEIERLLDGAGAAFASWRRTSFSEQSSLLHRIADVLEERRNAWATLTAVEMGKPVMAGRAEIEKCAWVCRYYASTPRTCSPTGSSRPNGTATSTTNVARGESSRISGSRSSTSRKPSSSPETPGRTQSRRQRLPQ